MTLMAASTSCRLTVPEALKRTTDAEPARDHVCWARSRGDSGQHTLKRVGISPQLLCRHTSSKSIALCNIVEHRERRAEYGRFKFVRPLATWMIGKRIVWYPSQGIFLRGFWDVSMFPCFYLWN